MDDLAVPSKAYRLYPSMRLCVFLLLMAGNAIYGGVFVAFNFSLVCMVNETTTSAESIGPSVNNTLQTNTSQQCGSASNALSTGEGYNGQFVWSKTVQANLLAAHSYGALVSNMPSGVLADRFGSKIIIALCLASNVIGAAVLPTAAYAGPTWVFIARVVQGFGYGGSWPAVVAMASVWGTARDTSTLLTFSYMGYYLGFFLAMVTSSVICDSAFGWPLAFYMWSGISLLLLLVWIVLSTDAPQSSRWICKKELDFLEQCNMKKSKTRLSLRAIPWRRVLFSPCVAAICICQFSSTWVTYFISEFMPTYSKEVLYFDIRSNGLTSGLPSLCHVVGRCVFGPLGDKVSFRGRSKTFNSKVFNAICTVSPALCFLLIGFLDCNNTVLAVAAFSLASAFLASSSGGYHLAGVHVAPRYSGLIGSIYIGFAFISAIVLPYAVNALASHGRVEEWQHTAFLTAAVMAVSFFAYQMFGSAEEQEWAKEKTPIARKVHVIDANQESMQYE